VGSKCALCIVATALGLVGCGRDPEVFMDAMLGYTVSPPGFGDDCVGFAGGQVLGQSDSHLRSIDGATGELVDAYVGRISAWHVPVSLDGDALLTEVVEVDEEREQAIFALGPDGVERWRLPISETASIHAYAVARSGSLCAICKQDDAYTLWELSHDGTLEAEHPLGGVFYTLALGADDTVYLVGDELLAMGPSGEELWRRALPNPAYHLSLGEDSIVIAVADPPGDVVFTRFYAYDLDGELWWGPSESHVSVGKQPAIGTDGTIYVSAQTLETLAIDLYALDGHTGEPRWVLPEQCGDVALGKDGKLYAICGRDDYGTLTWFFTAIDIDDGDVKWEEELHYPLGSSTGEIHGAPSMCGGNAYFGVGYFQGTIYGLNRMPALDPDAPWPRTNGGNANRRQVNLGR